jgi:hypothetical protein
MNAVELGRNRRDNHPAHTRWDSICCPKLGEDSHESRATLRCEPSYCNLANCTSECRKQMLLWFVARYVACAVHKTCSHQLRPMLVDARTKRLGRPDHLVVLQQSGVQDLTTREE